MKKLMRIVSTYCCDNEAEAEEIIKAESEKGILAKKSVEVKSKKKKGEIVAEKLKVTTTTDYDTDWFDEESEG